MKRILTLLAGLALATGAFAQQALFRGPGMKSPEIHADGSVTFRLSAPKAVLVKLTGDMLEEGVRSVDMVEEDGVWTYTTAPLTPRDGQPPPPALPVKPLYIIILLTDKQHIP